MDDIPERLPGLSHLLIACLIFAIIAGDVAAIYTVDVDSSSETVGPDGTGTVEFTVKNRGDETAMGVSIGLEMPEGFEGGSMAIDDLAPNGTATGSLPFKIPSDAENGSYPAPLMLVFKDTNQYPITMVFPQIITKGPRAASMVSAQAPNVNLSGNRSVSFPVRIMNRDDEKRRVRVRIHMPLTLRTAQNHADIDIPPRDIAEVEFMVCPFGALAGSNLLVHISTQSEEGRMSYSTISRGYIRTERPKGLRFEDNPLRVGQDIMIYLAAGIILIFISWRVRMRWKRS